MANTGQNKQATIGFRWLFNMVAFFALAIVGLALLIALIAKKETSFATALLTIAEVLAYMVVAFYAFFYAVRKRGKKQLIYLAIWAVAVVLIIVCVILQRV